MELSQTAWIGIIGALMVIAGLLAWQRKGPAMFRGRNRDSAMYAGLGIGVVLLLFMGGLSGLGEVKDQLIPQTGGGDQTPGPTPGIECTSQTQPSLKVNTVDKLKAGTTYTNQIWYRQKGTAAWTTSGKAGTGFAAQALKTYEIVAGAANDSTGSLYGKKVEVTVPCESYPETEIKVAAEATAASVGVTVFNNAHTAATATAIGIGDIKTVYLQVDGQYQKSLGNVECGANSNVLGLYYNLTEIDKVTVEGQSQVECPRTLTPSSNSENTTVCFSFPVLEGTASTGEMPIVIDADDTNNPGASTSKTVSGVIFDSAYYMDAVTGEVKCGVTDEDGNDLGISSTSAPAVSILYS